MRRHDRARGLEGGVSIMAGLLGRTLGPATGQILSTAGNGAPESLEDSATVARRVTRLPVRRDNTGAMLVRDMAQTVRRRHGDGAASAAVLAQAMITRASRVVAAGANPVLVRQGIERGVAAADAALAARAVPAAGAETLARLATGATGDAELGALLGEMFDVLGEQADIVVSERMTPGLDREYVDGARWTARPAYRELLPDGTARLTLQSSPGPAPPANASVRGPLVVAVDQVLTVAGSVAAIELGKATRQQVVVVARDVDEPARRLLVRHHHGEPGTVVATMIMSSPERRRSADLADVALLTGGVLFSDETGRPPRSLRAVDCGRARQVVVARRRLEIAGGAGDPGQVAARVAALTAQAATHDRGDRAWAKLRARAARLAGTVGVLEVGAHSDRERELISQRVAKAQRVLELAMSEGVVPGGGVAYLQCVPYVHAAREGAAADERWGYDVVAAALEAPFQQIVANQATVPPDVALYRVRELGDGWGYDVRSGGFAPMSDTGVVDSAGVARGALAAAGSLAATVAAVGGVVPARNASVHG